MTNTTLDVRPAAPVDTVSDAPATPVDTPATPVDTPATPFHRLALDNPRHRWWKPILTVVVTVAIAAVLTLATVAVAIVADALLGTGLFLGDDVDMNSPAGALVGFGSVAMLLPAVAIAVRLVEGRRLGTLSSIAGRLRWNLLAPGLAIAAILYACVLSADLAEAARTGAFHPTITAATAPMLLVGLLVVPFQSAAEEYVFRALPMQALGSWLKSPWWGILLPAPLFMLGHAYNPVGQVGILVAGIAAGILVWRTGGLEGAIALHVINNAAGTALVAFGLADANNAQVTLAGTITSIGLSVGFTVLFCRLADGRNALAQR